jgi:transposase-like protein
MARRGMVDGGKEQRWRELLRRFAGSGLTVRAFCRQHRLAEPSFYWWRRELQRRGRRETKPAFVPVRMVAETRMAGPDSPANGGVEVRVAGGRCIRVRPGFDATTLARVLAVLEGGGPC